MMLSARARAIKVLIMKVSTCYIGDKLADKEKINDIYFLKLGKHKLKQEAVPLKA